MEHLECVREVLEAVKRVRAALVRNRSKQVGSRDEKNLVKTLANLWFRKTRCEVVNCTPQKILADVDEVMRRLVSLTARYAARATYLAELKKVRKELLALEQVLPIDSVTSKAHDSNAAAPDFSALVNDEKMQDILNARWQELHKCLGANAYLASVVMAGGLLESVLLARANQLPDKTPLTRARRAPRREGKVLPIQNWTLNHYLEVGHELGWISDAAKQAGTLLRDYRNLVHPECEARRGTTVTAQDATFLCGLVKVLVRQLLPSSD